MVAAIPDPALKRESAANVASLARGQRIAVLDGLRGIAILLVLLWHGFFSIPFQSTILAKIRVLGTLSWSGVDLFFVLSGFLIGGILLDVRSSPRYFTTFYIRRAYRILPLYLLVLACEALWPLLVHGFPVQSAEAGPIPFAAYVLFVQNFWMAWLGTFGGVAAGVTWSLAIEEQFYLTVPLLVRRISRRSLVMSLMFVIVAAPALRVLARFMFPGRNFAAYVLMPCRADALCCGVLCAVLTRTPDLWQKLAARRSALAVAAIAATPGLAWLTYERYSPFAGLTITVGYSLLAFFYSCVLLLALTGSEWLQKILSARALKALGQVAYFVYLFHLPIMEIVRLLSAIRFAYWSPAVRFLSGGLGIALTLGLGKLSWRFYEEPLLRRGHRHSY